MKNSTEIAYSTLLSYVKRNKKSSTFDGNTLRDKLSSVKGLKPTQFGGVINRALRNNVITKMGETTSNDPRHHSGRVGVYSRGQNSYSL